jgi:hypothetical protein
MKKALVVLLILAVAGGVFAQGWAFTGYADTGIGVFIPDGENGARARVVSRDAGVAGNRVQFAGAYSSEAGDYGFSFCLRADNAVISLNYGYGWLSGLNGIITGYAGVINNDLAGVNTGDLIFNGRGGEGTGLYTVVKPLDILSVGFGVFGGTDAGGWAVSIDQDTGSFKTPNPAYTIPTNSVWPQYLKYSGGVAVTIPETVKFVASFRNANKASTVGTGVFDKATGIGNDAQVAAGANLLMVQGLKASVAGVFNRVDVFSDHGIVRIFETAEYTGIENLTVGLGLWQALVTGSKAKDAFKAKMQNTDGSFDDPGLSFRGWVYVSYGLLGGKIVPRLDLNYLLGGSWDNEYRIPFDGRFYPNFDSKANLFNIRPSVGFQVTKNAWFELGYIVNKYLGDRGTNAYAVDSSGTEKQDAMNQAIYADIKVTW